MTPALATGVFCSLPPERWNDFCVLVLALCIISFLFPVTAQNKNIATVGRKRQNLRFPFYPNWALPVVTSLHAGVLLCQESCTQERLEVVFGEMDVWHLHFFQKPATTWGPLRDLVSRKLNLITWENTETVMYMISCFKLKSFVTFSGNRTIVMNFIWRKSYLLSLGSVQWSIFIKGKDFMLQMWASAPAIKSALDAKTLFEFCCDLPSCTGGKLL